MKVYKTDELRNVVVVGHTSVGKTTLTEASLFVSGATTRMGSIEDGNTVSDYDEDEHRRKFSLNLSLIPVEWAGKKVNLIDTPGYADFVSEVICGAVAADAALVVVDAVAGPEVGTDRAWTIAEREGLPRFLYVNRMDRENANFAATVERLRAKWGSRVAAAQLPIGEEATFRGVIDLLRMRAYVGEHGEESEVPEELRARAEEARAALVEAVVETDEALMEKYFADEPLTHEELVTAFRAAALQGRLYPVFCGAAAKRLGVRELLNSLVAYAPSPQERPPLVVDGEEIRAEPSGSLVVRVFKTAADPFVGKLSYLRVIRGTLAADTHVWNANTNADERVATLFVQRGKEQMAVPQLFAGDIGVVTKLGQTSTGDTLCERGHAVVLPRIAFPNPVFSLAVKPVSKAAVDKLLPSLQRLIEEDPGLRLERDPATGETILSGLGDAHLEVTVERLRRKFNVDVELALPRVPYRETISKRVTAEYTHKKQTGGHGQYGRVAIEVSPLPRGAGLQFESRVVGGAVPKEYIPAVEKGIVETAHEGMLPGIELTDIQVVLYDGKHHPVDSSEMSFKLAASQALKEAVQQAGSVLLEPIMLVRVRVPDEFAGDVVSDLNGKRARIHGVTPEGGGVTLIEAEVPLAEIQRYAADLRSLTQGRGVFEAQFDHYGEVPPHIAQKVREEYQKALAEAH